MLMEYDKDQEKVNDCPSMSPDRAEKIGESTLKMMKERNREQAIESGRFWARELKTTERQFANQLKRSEDRSEAYIRESEFSAWEKDARDNWDHMKNAELDAGLSEHERAKMEASAILYLNPDECVRTIEAQSGNFYFSRMRKLLDAIEAAGELGKNDLESAKEFPDAVAEHLRFKFTPRDELRDEFDTGNPTTTWRRVDEARNRAHNNSIRQLNALNELAEKYGTPRLTFRNFRTKGYLENLPMEEDRIAENDRATVEAYYTFAFRNEVTRLIAKQRRASEYGLY